MNRLIPMSFAAASLMLVQACEDMTTDQRTLVGASGGAVAGLMTAAAFDADSDWRLIAALGGAAVGTMVAQNDAQDLCAYSRGDGTYFTAPCP